MPQQHRSQESIDTYVPFKRGDLEGYVAAKDFASKPFASCTRSGAFAKIRSNNVLRADLTPREYIDILIKQGQVPDKHFKYGKTDTGYEISENNSFGEVTKCVIFNDESEVPVVAKYFTPDTGRQFKEVRYHANGKVETHTNYEDIFIDENETLKQMEQIEDLRRKQNSPPPTVENLFAQEVPITAEAA